MNPGEGYRLLEVGEVLQDGDEFWGPATEMWRATGDAGTSIKPGSYTYRRKLPAPAEENADTFFRPSGWVSFSERAPAKSDCPFVALFAGHNNEPQSLTFDRVPASAGSWSKDYYAWQSIPKPPAPPKSDAEIAWERYAAANTLGSGLEIVKAAFIAGFNAEVAK